MSRTIISLIEAEYLRYKGLGEGALEQLDAQELLVDAESVNSVATIVWHISGCRNGCRAGLDPGRGCTRFSSRADRRGGRDRNSSSDRRSYRCTRNPQDVTACYSARNVTFVTAIFR